MTKHTRRAGSRSSGFSFVELLVTIIIAGIAFAAMVPLFVQAQKQTSADKMRLIASNVAQDRLEKVRQVDYELLTQANLQSGSFYFGQFGTTWTQQTASGTKQFTVGYRVVEDAAKATKTVTVNVDWVGPPYPHKTVTMTTVVYRQWQGPTIAWSFTPDADPIGAGTLRITVTVDSSDIDAMKPVTVGDRTLMGRVVFMIEPLGGAPFPSQTVYYNSLSPSQYVYDWPVPGVDGSLDGNYAIRAVAYTANGYPGNSLSTIRRVETGAPQPVTNLQVTAGNGSATLDWTSSISGDIAYYEVYRRDLDGGEEAQKIAGGEGWLEIGYIDRGDDGLGLPTGSYEYTVYAVDLAGNRAGASASVEILNNLDGVPPALATELVGSVAGSSVTLSWTASLSDYTTHYSIYKDGELAATVDKAVTSRTINQGWDTTAAYQVKAVSFGVESLTWATLGPLSAGCAATLVDGVQWLQATTLPQYFTLNITNQLRFQGDQKTLLTLKLEKLVGASFVVVPTSDGQQQFTNVAFGQTRTWTLLTPGQYRWTWTYTNKQGVQQTNSRSEVFTGTPENVTVTVP